jgi:hypothetical protein
MADEELYKRYECAPRPNALYDSAGNRTPLDPADPAQSGLRSEWMQLYKKYGGNVEGKPSKPGPPVTTPVVPCPKKTASLDVIVTYTPYPVPVWDAAVEIVGPTPGKQITDAAGMVHFTGLVPGDYEIKVKWENTHPLVETALPHVGSTDWAVAASKAPYPSGANKCNLFVYEMANASGYPVPKRTRFSWRRRETVWYPPLAGEWADDSISIGSWSAITEADAAPGDMVAEAVNYSDATGHVGLISYPLPNSKTRTLGEGEHAVDNVTMERQVISAGSDEILNNDYFWSSRRHGTPHYKRHK